MPPFRADGLLETAKIPTCQLQNLVIMCAQIMKFVRIKSRTQMGKSNKTTRAIEVTTEDRQEDIITKNISHSYA